jgi:hypothetical protein
MVNSRKRSRWDSANRCPVCRRFHILEHEMSRTPQVRGEASDVGSIEQLGGRDVAHRDRPEGLQREELLDKSALTAQWNLAPH